jgi:hypothetical protein
VLFTSIFSHRYLCKQTHGWCHAAYLPQDGIWLLSLPLGRLGEIWMESVLAWPRILRVDSRVHSWLTRKWVSEIASQSQRGVGNIVQEDDFWKPGWSMIGDWWEEEGRGGSAWDFALDSNVSLLSYLH